MTSKHGRPAITSPRFRKFKPRLLEAKTLLAAISLVAVLSAYRFYDYWTSGFYVSDEYGYFYNAIHGQVYSDRWFFSDLNTIIFRLFGIRSVDAFSYLLPFYIFFWASTTFYILFRTLRLLSFDERTVAVSLASSFALISFVLLSLGFLTEPVGLTFAVFGIYLLVRVMKARSARDIILSSFLAACSFGAAAGTREPYNAFLVAGVVIVLGLAYSKRRESLPTRRLSSNAVLLFSVLAFALTAGFFLVVPSDVYAQQVAPLTKAAFTDITNPQTITAAAGGAYPWYARYVATNTLVIFLGGVVMGWGPLCFAIALGGFAMLLRGVRRSTVEARLLLVTALIALASYLLVSFIFAPDPTYFTFENYSTIIRFSDTALPAYFVCAPFFLTLVAKNRKRILGLAAVVLVFLALAVPVYQTYASSNLNYTAGTNPFQLGYKTDAALLRNYFHGVPDDQRVYLVGVPYGWDFTPGVQDLSNVVAYSIGTYNTYPDLTFGNLTSVRPSHLYVYLNPAESFPTSQAFISNMLNGTSPPPGSAYAVVRSQVVVQGADFALYEIGLQWR